MQLRRLDLLEARLGELPDLVADAFDRRARRFDCSRTSTCASPPCMALSLGKPAGERGNVERISRDRRDTAPAAGGVLTVCTHPQVIGRGRRIPMLDPSPWLAGARVVSSWPCGEGRRFPVCLLALTAGGARPAAGRDRLEHAQPVLGDDRRLAPVASSAARATGIRPARHAPDLRRERRRLAGDILAPGRQLRVQGRAQQLVGRELRPARGAERREHPARPRRRADVKFYYDHKTHWVTDNQSSRDRRRGGKLPVRARLPGRLGSELPALVARGSGRRRHLHVRDDGAAQRARTRPRSRSTRAGTRTTARAAS